MQNLYTQSQLMTEKQFKDLEKAFENSWSKETTNPDILDEWLEENKAYGQCAITALVVYDLFGGRIIYDKANYHLWNELPDGTQQDLSREQFQDERTFSVYKYKTKNDILYDETGLRLNNERRYKLLKERVQALL